MNNASSFYPDDSAEWVDVSPHMMRFGRASPHSRHPGVEMHAADLSILCSALEEHLKTNVPPATFPSGEAKDATHTFDLCVSQFGEWPSRPDMSG